MKTVIKKQFVHLEEGTAVRPQPLGAAEPGPTSVHRGPGIRVIELEGTVRAIEVTCSCGEVSVIELDSPRNTANPEVPTRDNA